MILLVIFTCILILHATTSRVCSALILEFDGSWRPSPRDPVPGFRSSQTSSQASISSTAAASAALFRSLDDDGNSVERERLFAIGAKSLSNTQTSADAEYEGLLMGLEHIEDAISLHDDDVLGEQELIIRGDCKAIIDQLNTRSSPRKTERYYEEVVKKIEHIRHCSSVTTIEFEHVLRESNTLCDALCKLVLNINQKRAVASVLDCIWSGEEESLSNKQNTFPNINIRKRSIKKKSLRPKSNHYEAAMEEILNSSRICQSSRLALACSLSKSAIRTNDVAILLQMSDFYSQYSRMFNKIYWGDTTIITTSKQKLRSVSVMSELTALLLIGAKQEAEQLRKKDRSIAREDGDITEKLNEELDSILELCTTNKGEMQGGALFPYSEVFTTELIYGVNYQQQLLEWTLLANDSNDLRLHSGIWSTNNFNSCL